MCVVHTQEAAFPNSKLTFDTQWQINYFKLLATMGKAGVPMNPEANRKAMAVRRSLLPYSPVFPISRLVLGSRDHTLKLGMLR
jgi:hypothetical protein